MSRKRHKKKRTKPPRQKQPLTAAARKRRRETMIIFINGKQKRVPRPQLIDGLEVDEFIRRNADPIWLHQNEMWEVIHELDAANNSPAFPVSEWDNEIAIDLNVLLAECSAEAEDCDDPEWNGWTSLNMTDLETREDVISRFVAMDTRQRLMFLADYAHQLTIRARGYFVDNNFESERLCNEALHRISGHMTKYRRTVSERDARSFITMIMAGAAQRGWSGDLLDAMQQGEI